MLQLRTSEMRVATDTARCSAAELAQAIAAGQLSASDAVEAAIARIEQVNPALNAVVVKRYAAARTEAAEADQRRARGEPLGPLHGVPITVKECLDLAGTPSTFGFASRASHRAEQDDAYVARLRAAGAIVVGKTNVAQALIFVETDNPLYGRTNNPWNLERTCGGSSGGEAAIIAAGGSTLGIGTDIGGSLRYPANFCGIASLKPTAGRTDDAGRYSFPIGQRAIVSQVGIMARTVEDVALGTSIISDGQPGVPALGDWRDIDVASLRVACYTNDGTFPVTPAITRAISEAAEALRRAGARVVDWQPPQVPHAVDLFYRILSADGGKLLLERFRSDPIDPRLKMIRQLASSPRWLLSAMASGLKASGQASLAAGLGSFGHTSAAEYMQAVEEQLAYRELFAQALDTTSAGRCDLILCPASPLPAFVHGATADLATGGGYTNLYNILGWPAGIVPVTRVRPGEEVSLTPSKDRVLNTAYNCQVESAGLPVGVQVVARPWQEHQALAAMLAIETHLRDQPDFPATPVM